jgi:putative chitinase
MPIHAAPVGLLMRGATGPAVRLLQQRLNALGYSVGSPDANFGPKTEAAVRAFQAANGLTVDGKVGTNTHARLFGASAVAAPAGGVGYQPRPGDVTGDQLRQIASAAGYRLTKARADAVAPHLNRAMADSGIDTKKRQRAFLAQVMHESGAFRWNEELSSGAQYEGRRSLGNTRRGDGRRFKGRGFIQLTGRANYTAASRDLGIDLVGNPQLAATDENAARVAGWFWTKHNLNRLADQGSFDTISRRINGGTRGRAERRRLHAAAGRFV